MKRILVTGGCGFIGTNLVERLLERGDYVIAMDNLYCSNPANENIFKDNPNYQFINHDVRDQFPDIAVDEIYHLAAPASPKVYMLDTVFTLDTIVRGTINALDCARKNNARIVISSTSEIYGESQVNPQNEEYNGNVKTMCLRSSYDESKRCAETYAYCYYRQYGVNVGVARLFNTYGPHMRLKDGRVVTSFVESYLNGTPLYINGDGSQTRSFCFISDLLNGLVAYMDSNIAGEAINIGNDSEISINTLAEAFMEIIGEKLPIEYCASVENEPQVRRPDLTKARKLINYNYSVSLKEGLAKTIAYFNSLAGKSEG